MNSFGGGFKAGTPFRRASTGSFLRRKDGEEGYSVYIPVPLEQAKTFRVGLKAGIEFLPKPPFFSTNTDRVRPTMNRPAE